MGPGRAGENGHGCQCDPPRLDAEDQEDAGNCFCRKNHVSEPARQPDRDEKLGRPGQCEDEKFQKQAVAQEHGPKCHTEQEGADIGELVR